MRLEGAAEGSVGCPAQDDRQGEPWDWLAFGEGTPPEPRETKGGSANPFGEKVRCHDYVRTLLCSECNMEALSLSVLGQAHRDPVLNKLHLSSTLVTIRHVRLTMIRH